MSQTIYNAYPEYTYPTTLTEKNGKDISADAVVIGLSNVFDVPPTVWTTPDVVTRPSTSAVTVQKLINSSTPAGVYWIWVKVTDLPEQPPRQGARITVI
jgi:hypothetical protein